MNGNTTGMQPGDWAQVAIAVVMFLATIAAFLTAYLVYRTRPLLMRTKELHSEHLKSVLDDWKNELDHHGMPKLSVPWQESDPFGLPVEGTVLFSDLTNHIGRDLTLFKQWNAFKVKRQDARTAQLTLYCRVKDYVKQGVGVDVLPELDTLATGINEKCIRWLYQNVVAAAERGRTISLPTLSSSRLSDGRSTLTQSGDWWAIVDEPSSIDRLKNLLEATVDRINDWVQATAPFYLCDDAMSIVYTKLELASLHTAMLRAIEETKATPILTGDCKYIDRAKEGLWPWRRKRSAQGR